MHVCVHACVCGVYGADVRLFVLGACEFYHSDTCKTQYVIYMCMCVFVGHVCVCFEMQVCFIRLL